MNIFLAIVGTCLAYVGCAQGYESGINLYSFRWVQYNYLKIVKLMTYLSYFPKNLHFSINIFYFLFGAVWLINITFQDRFFIFN